MTEYVEKVQEVIDEYPELEDVSEEAIRALGLAAATNAAEKIVEELEGEIEDHESQLEHWLDKNSDEDEN